MHSSVRNPEVLGPLELESQVVVSPLSAGAQNQTLEQPVLLIVEPSPTPRLGFR